MKPINQKIARISILLLATFAFTACLPERDNPWDALTSLDPSEWAPKNLQIEIESITSKILTWEYNGDDRIEGFAIDRKVGNANWDVGHHTTEKDTRSWTDETITPDSTLTYSYRVYAIAGDNKSSEITSSTNPIFPAPSNLEIEKLSDKSYRLTWTDNSTGEQGFKIDRRTDGGEWLTAYGTVEANQTAFVDTNVFVSKSTMLLEYRVYAYYNTYETQKPSIGTDALITAPSNLEITQNSISSVSLNWKDNSTGEEGFRVERKNGEEEWQQIADTKETTLNDNEFELNTTVYYRVSAYIEDYNSAYAEANFDATIPPPSNVEVEQQTNLQYKLTWTDNSTDEQGFKIDRRTGSGEWQLAYGEVDANQTSYTDPNVYSSKSLEVEYRVYAYYETYESVKILVSTQATIDAPTNLTITANSNTSVTLSWDYTQIGHQGFKVDRKAGDNDWQDAFTTIGATQTAYTDNTINLEETSFTYRVYAYYSQYNSDVAEIYIALPTITTSEVTAITATTATSGGNVTDEGSAAVSAKGVVWSTSQNPTLEDNQGITNNGTGTGTFTSNLADLTPGTTYYVRAYATSSVGTNYGNEQTFTTQDGIIVLSTTDITNITATTATSGGNVTDDGGAPVTARGVVWSTSQEPTITSNQGITSNGTGTGTFTSSLTNLTSVTTYYVRAYATNSVDTQYGNQVSFTTEDGLPTLTTTAVTAITASTATSGGDISDDGGFSVTARGVVWSTSQNPTIDSNQGITTDGTGTGPFTSNLTGLTPGTVYYVRAYATNSVGTSYGDERSFTTLDGIIELTTAEVTAITATSVTSGGNITSDGGAPITARGVVWSTTENPTIETNEGITSDGIGTGEFVSEITGLSASTTYYVKAYSTNSVGTAYGEQKSFSTAPPLDAGEVWNPVTGKIWMDRNLGASRVATSSTDAEAYGDLYQWGRGTDGHEKRNSPTTSTLSTSDTPGHGNFILAPNSPYDWRSPQNTNLWQGVNGTNNPCPSGYRLPTEAELNAERLSWGSNNSAGAFASPLKLPVAGYRDYSNGSLIGVGSNGLYWSSTVDGTGSRHLYFLSSAANVYSYYRALGYSVRCLKE